MPSLKLLPSSLSPRETEKGRDLGEDLQNVRVDRIFLGNLVYAYNEYANFFWWVLQPSIRHFTVSRKELCCRRRVCSMIRSWMPGDVPRCGSIFVSSFFRSLLQIVFCFFFQFLCSTAILGLQPKFKNLLGVGFLKKILS